MKRSGLPVAGIDVGELPLLGAADDAALPAPREAHEGAPRPAGPRRPGRSWPCGSPRVVVIGVAAVWTGYAKTMASERLKVGRVEVRGSRFLSEGEVRELLGPAVGENILGLDIAALKARLRSSPWVADATVARTLPDTLKVEITERVPLALAEVERLYLMDKNGGLIDLYGPRTASFDLPIVRGLMGVDAEARRDRAERAGALLDDLGDLGGRGLGGLRPALGRPQGRAPRHGRGAARGRAAEPAAGLDLPVPAQGPGGALPGRRVLRPALPRTHLREAAAPPPAAPRPSAAPRPVPESGGRRRRGRPGRDPAAGAVAGDHPQHQQHAAADPPRDDQGR